MSIRAPLRLPLEYDKAYPASGVATFDERPGQAYATAQGVRSVIEAITAGLTGNTKNVSDKPVGPTIKGGAFPNLVLMDIPGLVENTVVGQNSRLPTKIDNMVTEPISDWNTHIISVCRGDIANSKSIRSYNY